MIDAAVKQVVASGESERVEFKSVPSKLDGIGQTICAFLNTRGGTLIVGVDDRGQITGVKSAVQEAEKIQRDLLEKISPKAAWSVNVDEVDGKKLILVDVPQGLEKPYIYRDRIFVRRGAQTVVAVGTEITGLIDRRHAEGSRWERLPALGFEIDDLDKSEILQTAKEAQERRLYPFADPSKPLRILEQLGLASGGMLLNSAVILFGKNLARRFPQIRIRAARFKGESLTSFTDNRTFEGHAFALIEKIESFLRTHIPIESELPKKGVRRSDTPAYPWPALREGMLNAIVHRDYAAFDGGLSVGIHDDRIEFWNSGSLPEGITVESLKGPHPSRPHNPDIANVFFLRGFIERWGIGARQIVNQCREAGLPEPEWKTEGGGITLTIRLKTAPEGKTRGIELNARQIALLKRLEPEEIMNPGDYFTSVAGQVKERRARTDLLELTDAGYLRRVGRGPSTVYVRTEKPLP